MLKPTNLTKIRIFRQNLMERAGLDDSQVSIVSFPKSGRTWLRALIGKAICEQYNIDESLLLDTYTITKKAGALTTRFTHDGSEIIDKTPYRELAVDRSRFKTQKVLFIVRDPRDVLVSCYFQAIKRVDTFEGSISEFIHDDRFGIMKLVHWLNIWHVNQVFPKEFVLLTYEEMHASVHASLRRVLEEMNAQYTDDVINKAVEFASFESMREMEKKDQFGIEWMRPGDINDPESYKTRRGKVGGYVDYLTEEDIMFIDKTINDFGCPFLRQYYEEKHTEAV
jgi:hypothetical protein